MKAVIDRFEGDYAIVLFGDDEVRADIPRALLPADAKEGSWLNVSFELDPEGEKRHREKIDNLSKQMRDGKGD